MPRQIPRVPDPYARTLVAVTWQTLLSVRVASLASPENVATPVSDNAVNAPVLAIEAPIAIEFSPVVVTHPC